MAVDLGITFGAFQLFPDQRLLLEGNRPVQLGSRALEILITLAERPGELVSKDDLLHRVWPNTMIEEGSLRVHMSALRRALGEGQAGRRYILNVPGRGYRFVATTSATESAPIVLPPDSYSSNLPLPLSRVVGRADAVNALLAQVPRRRFVTLAGPGGVGKTTLALAVSNQLKTAYANGVWFVDLGPLSAPHHVASAIAAVLDSQVSTENPTLALAAFLRDRKLLLVLDSCDHVIDTVAAAAVDLLARAPGLNILATSREPLRAPGEYVQRLTPLELPPASTGIGADDGLAYPSIELFVERVAANVDGYEFTDQDAPKVAEICRKLDGLPLAIELAAARVDAFGISGLLPLLDNQLSVLRRGLRTGLARHQTLSATIDWSYMHLPEAEQTMVTRLSVFASRFTLEAAVAVAADQGTRAADVIDTIANLVAKSLIAADVGHDTTNFRLLESTRAYALEKLKSKGEFAFVSRRHAEYILAEIRSLSAASGVPASIVDEIRAALGWAFSPGGDTTIGVALTAAAAPVWGQLSLMEEARRWLEQAIAAADEAGSDAATTQNLHAMLGSALLYTKGPGPEIEAAWTRVLEIAGKLDDTKQQLAALWGLLTNRLNNYQLDDGLALARQFRQVAERSPDPNDVLVGERLIGGTLFFMGDLTAARRHIEGMLAQYNVPSEPTRIIRYQFEQTVRAKTTLAEILWLQGFPDQAKRMAEGNFDRANALNHDLSMCNALGQAACPIAILNGDYVSARRFTDLLLDISARRGLNRWHAWGRCFDGAIEIKQGNAAKGVQLLRGALSEFPDTLFALRYLGFLGYLAEGLGAAGNAAQGMTVVDNALERSERSNDRWCVAELLRIKAVLTLQRRSPEQIKPAEDLLRQSLTWSRQQGARSWELRTAITLARLYRDTERARDARDVLASAYGKFTEGFESADLSLAKALLDETA